MISIFIGLTTFLYNYVLSTNQKPLNVPANFSFDANTSTLSGVAAAMENTSIDQTDDGAMHQQSSTQLLRNVGRSIYEDGELWKGIKIDK